MIVFKERIYKIWKQFTTAICFGVEGSTLCSKNEYTKSESNSQHLLVKSLVERHCVQRTNIQNLKAIHNENWLTGNTLMDCVQRTNIQNLKAIHNECVKDNQNSYIVFKERIYKIWKQFTTQSHQYIHYQWLCSKNEYTKSESNSQPTKYYHCTPKIVFKERIYKIWKQFTTAAHCRSCRYWLCSKNEYTKSESNSQQCLLCL